ncbi:MAG: nucleotidyl transferase AbiEii/AbiGii toxin family protein [Candidatus Omnitrophota bacterium]
MNKQYPTIFHLFSDIFAKGNVDCVLIGGFAVNYYKVSRQTADVDFLITKEDFEKILNLLVKEGFRKDYEEAVFARLLGEGPYLMDVDFMFVDKDTLGKIIKDGKDISIAKQKFIVPSLNHLIALKLHAIKYNPGIREYRDLPDIVQLIKINKVNIKDTEFKDLCLKYGTAELYNKLLENI